MKKYDVVIILGGGIDGTLTPAFYTKERLDFFLKKKRLLGLPIVVTGGYPIADAKAPKYTEAEVMRSHLVKSGIPAKNIYLEKESRDTIGNAYYSKRIIKRYPHWKRVVVFTSKGHIPRARWIFKKFFGTAHKIDFLGVDARVGSLGKNPAGRKKYEHHIIRLYAEIFRSVRWDDDRDIARALKKFYSNTKETKEFKRKVTAAKEKFLKPR